MHIHPSSPNSSISSEESAATKIQAGFRGYRVRKQLKDVDATPNGNRLSNKTHRNATNCNDDAKCHQLKSSDSLDIEKCATKIQAGIRGFLVRKKQKVAENAATKIQAGFRGFRARKQLRDSRE